MDAIFSQKDAPLYEALNQYKANRIVPFDVPGHKQGKGNKELADFLGEKCLSVDVNAMKPLDNIARPISVIKYAQQLAAQAFGAKDAFFSVNGTTAAVQAMILYACKKGQKIIMPRNVHISAINALVLSGAVPVYVNPGVDKKLGISLGMPIDEVKKAIASNPEAKAVFINNPTYYGICSDIKEIIKIAHNHNMLVLVDEAHGTHFYFGENLPPSAMTWGADMSSVSMHKTGGSLTQSSILLIGDTISKGYMRQIISLSQTTSASYLLLSSLDISRRNLALSGREIFSKIANIANYARDEINKIGGYYAYSKELINKSAVFDFDITKLSVYTRDIGLAGIEVYDLLRDEYGIQIEFGDIGNILAIISVGDSELEIERLISDLYELKRRYQKDKAGMFKHEYIPLIVELTPQKAFYANKKPMDITKSDGYICGEFVMSYPPGIPILAPGERITREIIEYIL
ncbi:MAG: aminotransferase class I/II-fold pyridoxal phosphate-dependent enzyme, partial [Clostridiaceae bacterium]|nr:aminotransferase class I/II-fold pyridoxal phosphate-dependent enzyme [Clostridiaceae bacterium]